MATSYGYDNIYQLLSATQGATTTESYAYDAVGNRTSSLGVASYTTNSSNELTAKSGGVSYTYDNNGNELTKVVGSNTTTYAWDYENRLTSVTLPGSGGTVSFSYDPFGRRIKKSSGAGASIYAYDYDNLIEETNGAGGVVARYMQGENIDEPLAMLRSSATSFYHADGLGSVTSLSNGAGSVVQTYGYDSFGSQTSSSGSLTSPFQYTAREFDSETSLYYYRARYYDQNAGRFLGEDPIGFDSGVNFYAYVLNNPGNFVDPFGLKLCKVFLPGLGNTYLDDSFYPRVKKWMDANDKAGISVNFSEGFRTTEYQQSLSSNPNATTPAAPGNSLHEAGFAVDIRWSKVPKGQQGIVVQNAINAGLVWGGNFKHPKPGPVHFQRDPGNRKDHIKDAQDEYKKGVTCECTN